VFVDAATDSPLSRDATPGPRLCIVKSSTFDEALEIARSGAARTAIGVYSRKPSHLEKAQQSLRPRMLFLNGPTIVARVGREIGPHALRAFVRPRAVSENTMRSGFAPGLE
jgi:RHH-type proline utilization regulon transcriptional repressor/proline dehydrogenase/delta 1-pyrroline-5-carboxylate dehydrogenase